ncbi:type IV secretion system DNA-binding domain-containing protein [Bradyrhizobium japonicum]|uniref:type IV secretion system DNA-binding domain-containing protein n=1 Tax=Bradyrhizobium japonicum TaxID=375 RepID=UPI0003FB216B|nr:type IV secretion system DNA-binding domain-containing protein [Bradyrhizobium japonicum]
MAALPKLRPGLDLYRSSDEAVYVGFIVFLVSFGLLLAPLLALPAADAPFAWRDWGANLASLRHADRWATLLATGWPRVILAVGISMVAAHFARLTARDEAPLTEPFLTPDPRQPRIYYDHDARRRLCNRFRAEAGYFAREGIWLAPHLNLPFDLESRYAMIFGASGHGKSNLVRAYATQMAKRGDLLMMHCNKGDVTRSFDLKSVVLISPAHRDGWAWDIAADISGPAAAADFATDVVPASEQSFWSDTARLLLTDIICAVAEEKGRQWGARDLLEAVLSDSNDLRQRIESLDLSASPLLRSGEEDGESKTVLSIMATLLSAAMTSLRPMAYAWSTVPPAKRFSVTGWLSKTYTGPKTVIVQTSPNFQMMSTVVCGGILRRTCKELSDASVEIDTARRVSVVLDEFYSLGKIDGFARALSVAREKGLACVVALQSESQLKPYGDEAGLLLDLFQIKIYTRLTAGASAEWAEKMIGYRDIRWLAPNNNPAKDDKRLFISQTDRKPVVSAAEFAGELGVFGATEDDRIVRAVVHYAGNAYRFDWPLTTWAIRGKGFVPAAWTRFTKANSHANPEMQ